MNFLTNRSMTHLELTFKFLIFLAISYILYFSLIREYGTFLMFVSSNITAALFDMHVVNSGSYLEDVILVSNIGLQHSITNEIAYAQMPFPKRAVDEIMVVITNSSIILALAMLLVRSFKVLAVVLAIMVSIHIFSVSAVLTYFMFEVSPQSPILMTYLQALGVTQSVIDISYIFSGISFYYLKYFTPLFIAYYIWETDGHKFTQTSKQNIQSKTLLPLFMINKNKL